MIMPQKKPHLLGFLVFDRTFISMANKERELFVTGVLDDLCEPDHQGGEPVH